MAKWSALVIVASLLWLCPDQGTDGLSMIVLIFELTTVGNGASRAHSFRFMLYMRFSLSGIDRMKTNWYGIIGKEKNACVIVW